MAELVDEVTDLLQQLIRNACVNDGSVESGHEHRNADLLRDYLDGLRLDVETHAPVAGRPSVVFRIPGTDPDAPSLMLMGHTDVVPASPDRWRRDPHGGELVDGFVWGRGAIDMLNLTASMAVVIRRLAADPSFRPRGDLVYLAVADEEAGGRWGAEWLIDNVPDAVRTDYVLSEFGGLRFPSLPGVAQTGAIVLPITVAEKGPHWGRIRVTGEPGHGSLPLGRDNALVTAAEVVRRLAEFRPPARVTEVWRRFVEGLGLPDELTAALRDPDRVDEAVALLPDQGVARFAQACTHTTLTPTVVHGGVKANVIPDLAEITIDVRALPGETTDDVRALLDTALGDLADRVGVVFDFADEASSSPLDTPLWDALTRHSASVLDTEVATVPFMIPGGTDSRFLRRLGATCYGYGLYTERIPFDEFTAMFHGDDERIDQESLLLTTRLWEAVARDLLA